MNLFLAQACLNRFILVDCLKTGQIGDVELRHVHEALLLSGRDDALILTGEREQDGELYLQMKVLGADGNWGEFCGNGARACAAHVFSLYPHLKQVFLRIRKGCYRIASHGGQTYSVRVPMPMWAVDSPLIADLALFQREYGFLAVDALEPHLIVQDSLTDQQLLALGRALNARRDLFPYGINVNACHFLDVDRLYVRTFERGVQRLTASCGTGSLACVYALGQGRPMGVITVGGPLEISSPEATEAELRGGAFVEGQ